MNHPGFLRIQRSRTLHVSIRRMESLLVSRPRTICGYVQIHLQIGFKFQTPSFDDHMSVVKFYIKTNEASDLETMLENVKDQSTSTSRPSHPITIDGYMYRTTGPQTESREESLR